MAVNQTGQRVFDERLNALTVVANESYEDFAASLQKEIEDDFGADEAKMLKVTNQRQKKTVVRKPLDALPAEFRELWDRIRAKTRYSVAVDTPALVARVDVPEFLTATGIHLDLRTLGWLRLGLLGMAVGCIAAGLLCRFYGRREVFGGVREAVEYGVQRGLSAASYVVVRGGERVATPAARPPLDEARWRACVDEFPAAMAKLSADIRPARQGENVRVGYETAEGLVYDYRFGAHAYLVALAERPRTRRRPEAEVRHLIRAIQALASIHGS